MKRIMMIMLTIMMLSSCYYADQVFGDIKESHEMAQSLKKNRGGAIYNEKYKSGVYEAIKDVVKRPINNKVQFEGITLIIPANTYINQKGGSIVDIKTGYGLPINFNSSGSCTTKKVENKIYGILYNEMIPGVEEIAQKIIRVNGFTKTCNK